MEPLENKLKRAMEREDPPEDFAERVMHRVRAQAGTRTRPVRPAPVRWRPWSWLSQAGWRPALAGAMALLLLAVGLGYMQHRERQRAEQARIERLRGEQARAELMLALQITGTQLTRVRHVLVNEPEPRDSRQ